jgi:hypothetical protein
MQQTQGVVVMRGQFLGAVRMRWGMGMGMQQFLVVVGRQRPGWVVVGKRAQPQGLVESLPLQGEERRR